MVIELSSQLKIRSALTLAYQKRFYEALCILAQENTYESALNQIVCLSEMEEYAFACDVYRYTRQKYGETYAVYKDVASFEDVTENVLNICEPNCRAAAAHQGKQRADSSLLFDINYYPEDDDETISADYAMMAKSIDAAPPAAIQSSFYDVKSTQYYDKLVSDLEGYYMDGDEYGMKKVAKKILELETDYLPVVEAQVDIICYTKKYTSGIKYAKLLAQKDAAINSVCSAIDIIVFSDPINNLETLQILLEKAHAQIDQLNVYDLEDYIHYASSYLRNRPMAADFANALFDLRDHAGLEALKMCAYAFLNVGDLAKAKQAALLFKQAVPNDIVAPILFDYINTLTEPDNLPTEVPSRLVRHFYLPVKFGVYAQRKLTKLLQEGNKDTLDATEFFYLRGAVALARSYAMNNQLQEYSNAVKFVRIILSSFDAENKQDFVDFAKDMMSMLFPDQNINACLIELLLQNNYNGKAIIGLADSSYYCLNFDKVYNHDEIYREAFAICASLCKITHPGDYLDLYTVVDFQLKLDHSDKNLARKVAYALMAYCCKDFWDGPLEELFQDDEKTLYQQIRNFTKH